MDTTNKVTLKDVYEDLREFKETRQSVNELLRMKRALIDQEHSDLEKINQVKDKAMDAINNLFAEDGITKSE